MFEVNKALAHARAHVTVRLTKTGYKGKGNLTGVVSEHTCADELLNYAPVVINALKNLDPEVAYMERLRSGSSCGFTASRWTAT
jgi:hypothetical protein